MEGELYVEMSVPGTPLFYELVYRIVLTILAVDRSIGRVGRDLAGSQVNDYIENDGIMIMTT